MPMISRRHRQRSLLLLALALGFGSCALLGVSPVGAASVRAAVSCDLHKDGRKLGTTYVTSLRVSHVSCTAAKRLVKAFHACRRANGGVNGRCEKRVNGYRCTERRGDSIPTQYSAKVSCRRLPRTVRFTYTQYT
jgi:hypothetical protein